MKEAMQNVEQVRLRMQRASERIGLEGTPAEGELVKKKKKSKKAAKATVLDGGEPEDKEKKKRRKKRTSEHEPQR
jgi:AP-3 complex subunit delta-1